MVKKKRITSTSLRGAQTDFKMEWISCAAAISHPPVRHCEAHGLIFKMKNFIAPWQSHTRQYVIARRMD